MKTMFVTHIRPLLEYNSEIWSPFYLMNIDMVENIQRRFTKRVKGLWHTPYAERLRICELEPLELRRIKRDVVLVYKVIKGYIGLD